MKQRKAFAVACTVLLAALLLLSACARTPEKTVVKVLIVPKFEVGEMSGDFPGEAQLFYERYCADCKEIAVPNATPTTHFYMDKESGVGILVTGAGKSAAGLSLVSLLSWDAYDFSDATVVSVGCGGANTGVCVPGDVVVVTSACDFELGHRTDSSELKGQDSKNTWFPDDSFIEYSCEHLNPELCEKVFNLIKDCPLRTTELTKSVLAKNFPNEIWAQRDPHVMKGTSVTGDSYWKGEAGSADAGFIAQYYECPDEYAITEMEDIAILNAAECFGMKDRVISLRVAVNMDTFLKGETPEKLWVVDEDYNEKVAEENSETLDIFEPGMQNLFDTGSIVIDALLEGTL